MTSLHAETRVWGLDLVLEPPLAPEHVQAGEAAGLRPASTTNSWWTSSTRKTDSSGTTSYLLDGMSIVAEYDGANAKQAWYTQSLARIDEPLSVVNGSGKFWYQADALGSIYALANGSGAVAMRSGYDVFGEPTGQEGSVRQAFGFTGREHEVDSGLTYYRDRYMQAAFGRWTQADRLGDVDGPNRYAYVSGSPARYNDPSGFSAGLAAGRVLARGTALTLRLTAVTYFIMAFKSGPELSLDLFAFGVLFLEWAQVIDQVAGAGCPGDEYSSDVPRGSAGAMRRRMFEPSPKHGGTARGNISPAPKNGQAALDVSVPFKQTSTRRVGIDYETNEFVVFAETHPGKEIYHGYRVRWSELSPDMQKALRDAGMVTRTGKIVRSGVDPVLWSPFRCGRRIPGCQASSHRSHLSSEPGSSSSFGLAAPSRA